jgi:Ca-activated chloride channel homolog
MSLANPHTRRGSLFLLCLGSFISLLLFCSFVEAQETDPVDVISIRTDMVAVPVIVTDARGHRIPDLKEPDFFLTDDGRPAKIDYFASGTEHIALAFVLDNSGSLREQLARQQDAALSLFSRFGSGSSVAVIRFGQQARMLAPFSSEPEGARAAFSVPVNLTDRTAIFDAAMTAVQAYATLPQKSIDRRIAILISDGLDNASRTSAQQVIAAAGKLNVSFYVIQLPLFTPDNGRLVPRPAVKGFRDLAEKTGGRFFVAGTAAAAISGNTPVDLRPVFAAIEEDLRSQYVIGFYPGEAARDAKDHHPVVSVSNRKLKVNQLRTSYSLKTDHE